MTKLKLAGIFNEGEENHIKIKIEDVNSEKYIKKLIGLLNDLKISHYLNAEPEIQSTKYKRWIGGHTFYKTKDYIIHIIFGKDYLHLIVRCSLRKRKELLKFLK